MLEAAEFSLNKQAAVLLYLGIMTDTGCFRYENTTARTHEVVSRLMQFKIPVSELYRKLYETIPLNDLQYFTKVVSSFTPLFDGKVIYLELRRGVVKRFSEEFDLRDKIFRYLRAIKGAEVLVILTQQEKGRPASTCVRRARSMWPNWLRTLRAGAQPGERLYHRRADAGGQTPDPGAA